MITGIYCNKYEINTVRYSTNCKCFEQRQITDIKIQKSTCIDCEHAVVNTLRTLR